MKTKNKVKRKYNKEKFITNLANLAEFTILLKFSKEPNPRQIIYIEKALQNNFTMYELHLLKRFSEIHKFKNLLNIVNRFF